MPYVPLANSLWNRDVRWEQRLGTRSNTSRPWGFNVSGGVSNRKYAFASRVGIKGKKVSLGSLGWWSPVRAYSRTALSVRLSGREGFMNGETLDKSTMCNFREGLPLQSPIDPTGVFNADAAATAGLINGGLPVLDSNTKSRLEAECMNKIGNRKASFGSAFGEARSTLGFIAKTALTVLRAFRAMKRFQFGKALKLLRVAGKHVWANKLVHVRKGTTRGTAFAARRWLELQYAWKPMLGDIYDAYKIGRDGLRQKALIIKASRQLADTAGYSYTSNWATLKGSVDITYRCKMWYRVSNPAIDALSQIGLINPLEVAWDLLPFSFVVDWFVPVGSLMEAYSSTLGLSFIDGVISVVGKVTASGKHTNMGGWAYYVDGNRFQWDVDYYCFQRFKASPYPGLYVKSPFSTTHLYSALALLRQLRR